MPNCCPSAPTARSRQDWKPPADLDPTAAPFFYLCGVTSRYAENLHIAFAPDPDSTIRYEDAHIAVVITGRAASADPAASPGHH